MLDRLMATSRHIGLNIVLNSQQYVGLSTLQRKSLSCIGIFKVHARELDGGHLGAGGQEQRIGGRSLRGLQNRDGEGARLPLDPPPGQESGRDAVLGVYETNCERLKDFAAQGLRDTMQLGRGEGVRYSEPIALHALGLRRTVPGPTYMDAVLAERTPAVAQGARSPRTLAQIVDGRLFSIWKDVTIFRVGAIVYDSEKILEL